MRHIWLNEQVTEKNTPDFLKQHSLTLCVNFTPFKLQIPPNC